ncbi:hypothetical protein ARMGADRAFT_1084538 [Armillaria gallica]|uniref:Uncharacterized protein n=1 Tax=Armillaria gallica TaxID=47427 RepID=A0A2H3CZZ3_ARMGA|nr:hypothetical protein ARMGADRAFT_1084538 [Armillaria gallica]
MKDGELLWTLALEECQRAAVRDIQLRMTTNWFEPVKGSMNPTQPFPDDWEDWMWEKSTWTMRVSPDRAQYYFLLAWNQSVEKNQPEDRCRQRVLGTDWEGAREVVVPQAGYSVQR